MSFIFDLGNIHTFFASLALLAGALVLFNKKGNFNHKLLGYIYVLSMLLTLITAFSIYDLFGSWGVFHWAALVGSYSLLAGFIPAFTKKPKNDWLHHHYQYMAWSYIGLVAAAFSEIGVRLPVIWPNMEAFFALEYFWLATISASTLVCFIGAGCIYWLKLGYPIKN